MRVRLCLGPAGTGKTFRCLTEARQTLAASPDGDPLLLLAPKQATYQLERQLLSEPSLPGYTRLQIVSFERLARFIFERLQTDPPRMLNEEGRLMVLRGLLARKRDDLKLFRASARLTGFAQQLNLTLHELQHHQFTPESLRLLADQVRDHQALVYKLHDLATLLQDYLDWLKAHELRDADQLLSAAAMLLKQKLTPTPQSRGTANEGRLRISRLWMDGFAELSPQELDLLAALLPSCEEATIMFCLDDVPSKNCSWLSPWSSVRQSFERCRERFAALPESEVTVECLPRDATKSRFVDSPLLRHLEKHWVEPQPFEVDAQQPNPRYKPGSWVVDSGRSEAGEASGKPFACPALRLAVCLDPEAEVTEAAREILGFVRAGNRFREASVLVRKLEAYHHSVQHVFPRYGIPFFLDRRESVAHHPMAELTRSALRTVAFNWQRDDWFAALKTGLVPARTEELDRLENEALARGWKGAVWQNPIVIPGDSELTTWLARLLRHVLPPFQRLALALKQTHDKPTGPQLAAALKNFWTSLAVEGRLQEWGLETAGKDAPPSSVHTTVWEQMLAWVANVELAFSAEALPLREWLPILDAGLANLTVGVIPPALDQVLVGAIDRSRNPDIKLALVLGLNETIFPSPPQAGHLLTETDRLALERQSVLLGSSARHHLGRERFFAYIACTRARHRVVLTCALNNADGVPLNPSPFLLHVRRLFPALEPEVVPQTLDWQQSEHVSELLGPLLKSQTILSPEPQFTGGLENDGGRIAGDECRATDNGSEGTHHASRIAPLSHVTTHIATLPTLTSLLDSLRQFQQPKLDDALSPEVAAQLYGPILRTSVSRMEQFAACPFKFFVHSGLRAEERQRFELDAREQGSFQHEVLALFHQQLDAEHKQWRDITPDEARQRVATIVDGLLAGYREGLLQASEQTRFLARSLTESLQNFVATLIGWMQTQYRFEPVAVELAFGEDTLPAWRVDLGAGRCMQLTGRIDRIDLHRETGTDHAQCVVVDYKSSQKKLDPLLLEHGLQLQLLGYLNVLRHWPNPRGLFGVTKLLPTGVFYVSLRGRTERAQNRLEALDDAEQARKMAYRHTGRFDLRALRLLDSRPDARRGDQFNYSLNEDGELSKKSPEGLPPDEFTRLLDSMEMQLKSMGQQIYAGHADVAPFRKSGLTACDQCSYGGICRIDPWVHRFRVLKRRPFGTGNEGTHGA